MITAARPRAELRYTLHGVRITVSGEPRIVDAVGDRFGSLPSAQDSSTDELQFDFRQVAATEIGRATGPVRTVYTHPRGTVAYAPLDDLLYLAFEDRLFAVCDPAGGRMQVSIVDLQPDDVWLLTHPFISAALHESFKRRGLYSLHAAGVSRAGSGILLVGGSGAGKSTLAVALARAGFDLLGDDTVFLSRTGLQLAVRAFPDQIDVSQNTLEFFPELRWIFEIPRRAGFPKWSFPVDVLGGGLAWACAPAVVVFPRVAHSTCSKLEPISSQQALLDMVENVLPTEHHASQRHLDVLSQLCNSVPCFRLSTGTDLPQVVDTLGALIRG